MRTMPSAKRIGHGSPKTRPTARPAARSCTPPASICAAALIGFEAGSASLRVRIVATDQLNAATSNASAPAAINGSFAEREERIRQHSNPAQTHEQSQAQANSKAVACGER